MVMKRRRSRNRPAFTVPHCSVVGLLLFIGAVSLSVWGLEREPPYDVFRGYTHTFEAEGGGGQEEQEHERLTRERWENRQF